jgi:hypothetical protein
MLGLIAIAPLILFRIEKVQLSDAAIAQPHFSNIPVFHHSKWIRALTALDVIDDAAG